MASRQPPRGRGWGGGSGPCHSAGPGGRAGGQGGGHGQLWLRPDLSAERASARPARHSPSPPLTHPPGPEHGWAVSQWGWLGHSCARQTRTGGRVFQGGRPAPALLVSPPGPAGSSQLLSWPTRSRCLDGVLSAQTVGTGAGGSRVSRGQAGDPPKSQRSQQPLPTPAPPHLGRGPRTGQAGRRDPQPPTRAAAAQAFRERSPGPQWVASSCREHAEPGPRPRPVPGLPSHRGPSGPLQEICPRHKLRRMGGEGTQAEGPGAAGTEGRG